ncbi:MAG: UDP-N-acetylmuramate dehydrogenase [Clostridia bacterium]|nr:UDP-N-acetylmuramate dehydrogenase [Clostridia bacterium]
MIYEDIVRGIPEENIHVNESMSKHTSFKVGGVADYYIEVNDVAQLIYILKLAKKMKMKTFILGNGTNVIIKDSGFRGIIIKINFTHLNIEKGKIVAGAGVPVALLSNFAYRNGIKGYEFLSGIPGTVGGAVKMNAGAYKSEIKDILVNTTYLDEKYNIVKIENKEHEFSYRNSIFFKKNWIIIGSTFKIEKGDIAEIKAKRNEMSNLRKEKQPLELPNAGSIFKRSGDDIPAMLIDKAGLKGYKIGGAQISEKHAGFIVNTGDAKAKDILDLIKYTKEVIKKKYGKDLELEVIIL